MLVRAGNSKGMRRDITMLGLLHKVSLGLAPTALSGLFSCVPQDLRRHGFVGARCRHNHQLHDSIAFNHPQILKRSVFGLIRIYNDLPLEIVNDASVSALQRKLQNRAKDAARHGVSEWMLMYRVRR